MFFIRRIDSISPLEWWLFLLGAVFFLVGIYLWIKGRRLSSHGRRTRAIVIRNEYEHTKDGGYYYPIVQYLDDNKRIIEKRLSIGFSPAKSEGSVIEVIYDPAEPETVIINSVFLLEFLPPLMALTGAVLVAWGGFLFFGNEG